MMYLLGLIGAAVFYIQEATTFWDGVLGFLKALVWPAFLVYDLLRMASAEGPDRCSSPASGPFSFARIVEG